MIESICEGNDVEVEQAQQNYRAAGREVLGWDQGQADLMDSGLRWAVEARKKGRRLQEKEQRCQGEEEQHPGQWVLAMRNSHGQAEEVQASSEGEMRGIGRTRPGKAKERGNGGKG